MRKTTNLDDIGIFVAVAEAETFRVRSYPGIARGLFASRRYVQNAGMPAEPADLTSHRCIGSGRWTLSKGGKTVTPDIPEL